MNCLALARPGLSRLAALMLSLGLLACSESETEVWDVRADPGVCDNGSHEYLCHSYDVVEDGDHGTLYEGVDGFSPEWGHAYRIEVERYEIENPPLDGSPIRYELVEILSDEPQAELEFDVDLRIATVDVAQGVGEVGSGMPFTCEPSLCEALAAVIEQGWQVAYDTNAVFRFGSLDALLPVELVSVGGE